MVPMPRPAQGRRAVFLDRDGVLIEDAHYLSDPARLRLIAGAAEAVRELRAAGFLVIVASNQSGVARGYFTKKDLAAVTARLRRELRAAKTRLDAVYYCCHGPDDGCSCRKPGAALLRRAAARFGLDLRRSFLVGDKTSDLGAARAAGCAAVLVKTGKAGKDGEIPGLKPDWTAEDLAAAARRILRGTGGPRIKKVK